MGFNDSVSTNSKTESVTNKVVISPKKKVITIVIDVCISAWLVQSRKRFPFLMAKNVVEIFANKGGYVTIMVYDGQTLP